MKMSSLATGSFPKRGLASLVSTLLLAPIRWLASGWYGLRHRKRNLGLDRHQTHFGSLDDTTLLDLGLLRGELRAAEYGVVPPDQALHIVKKAPSPKPKNPEDDQPGA